MKKIPTIFARNAANLSEVTDERNSACDWVFAGEGIATRKWDGTAVLISDIGVMFKRYDCKKGRTPPLGFIEADSADPITGHWPGWVRVTDGPEDLRYREAKSNWFAVHYEYPGMGTYELLFPEFQGRDSAHRNPECVNKPVLVRHGDHIHRDVPRSYLALKEYFESQSFRDADFEGIVWHHPDGRMAKIKARDFGIRRI